MTASLHATAAIPLFLIHEGAKGHDPFGVVKKKWTVDEKGYCTIPEGPGLGITIDQAKVEKIHAQPKKYRWPRSKYPDGSVSDY